MGDRGTSRRPDTGRVAVGAISFDASDERWSWTPEVFALLGVDPEAVPSDDLLLKVVHPDDRDAVESTWASVVAGGELVSCSHRLVDEDGEVRHVLCVAAGRREGDRLTGVDGFLVDLSELLADRVKAAADAAVAASAERRATIEQAKGMLMSAYGLDPDAAFALLRWWSSHRNVKLASLAERLVQAAQKGAATSSAMRLAVDRVLDDLSRQ